MNKISKIILILSIIIFNSGFLFINSAQAIDNEIQFTPKNIWVNFDGLPFDMKNWAPGDSIQKTIIIKNDENFDINVYFKAATTSNNNILANVLTVTIDGKPKHLSDLFNNNIALTPVNSGKSEKYDIAIKFDETVAGEEYQNQNINFDFIITVGEIGGNEPIPPVHIPGGWGGGYITTTTTIPGKVAGAETEQTTTTTLPGQGAGEVLGEATTTPTTTTVTTPPEETGTTGTPENGAKPSQNWLWYLIGLIVIGGAVYLVYSRKNKRI